MAFSGYPKDIRCFFKELGENNNKGWFEDNKDRFNNSVMEPSVELVQTLIPELADLSPALNGIAKLNGSIRRIYRDTRFSKDKTPYHAYLHLIFWVGSGKPIESAGVHLALHADGFGFGAGHWGFTPEQLSRFRANVTSDGGTAVERAIAETSYGGVALSAPALKRVPRGFDPDVEGAQWLRHKGLVVRASDQPYDDALFGPEGVDRVLEICRGMAPLNTYLADNIFV